YVFDSFVGLPRPTGIDKSFEQFKEGEFSFGRNEFIKSVIANTKLAGKQITTYPNKKENKLFVVPGFYDQVLNKKLRNDLPDKKFSLVWIDCDLYKSTVPVLDFITDFLEHGSLLVLDDWFCFRGDPNLGQRKAIKEWLKKNKNISLVPYASYSWHGYSFIVHKKNNNEFKK
ncbi:MAG TPA: TylF/MycF/NovP-related O-methyltransferase, partial [Patescibacteria group bacterium]